MRKDDLETELMKFRWDKRLEFGYDVFNELETGLYYFANKTEETDL